MSWTSPLTVASTIVPLPSSPLRSMCGSRWATAVFMTSALCSTNGSCISPRPKSSPTVFMPSSSVSLTISSAGAVVQRLVEVGLEALALAVDDAALRAARSSGSVEQLVGARLGEVGGVDALEQLEEARQRVVHEVALVVVPPPVVDQVERGLALLVGDARHRHDLRRVHDRGVEPGLDALVQEHRVEHHARGRVEAEGDVRDAERGLHVGVDPLELADRLDRLDAVAARLLLARWRSGR